MATKMSLIMLITQCFIQVISQQSLIHCWKYLALNFQLRVAMLCVNFLVSQADFTRKIPSVRLCTCFKHEPLQEHLCNLIHTFMSRETTSHFKHFFRIEFLYLSPADNVALRLNVTCIMSHKCVAIMTFDTVASLWVKCHDKESARKFQLLIAQTIMQWLFTAICKSALTVFLKFQV